MAGKAGGDDAEVRIDKWLWAARFFKTRSLAQEACVGGHVQCNGAPVKPARPVRIGDHLEVLTPAGPRIVDVLALSGQRGPATVARALYDDKTPPPEPKDKSAEPLFVRDRGAGRPTKRDRRVLRGLYGRDS